MTYSLAEQLLSANTLDELAAVMEQRVKDYGFTGFAYWTHLRLPAEQLSASNTFLLLRGPAYLKAFEILYLGKRLYIDDPVVRIAAERTSPFSTLEIRQQQLRQSSTKLTRREKLLYRLERRFGLVHDIYLPVHTPLRVQVFYAYFQGNDPYYPTKVTEILPELQLDASLFVNSVVDFISMGSAGQDFSAQLLSAREQQCLAWMAKGRSNADIANILEVSERTVKFHIKNIMDKLHADNRTHAVALAARSGWLSN